MIIRTYRQCLKATSSKNIYIATDNNLIRKACLKEGAQVIMTSSKCLTGTDRIAEVSKKIKVDSYINVQGDEPIFNPRDIKKLIYFAKKNRHLIINGYCKIKDEKLFRSGNIPKVVFRNDGRLLYMSRAAIPTTKKLKYKTPQKWAQWMHNQNRLTLSKTEPHKDQNFRFYKQKRLKKHMYFQDEKRKIFLKPPKFGLNVCTIKNASKR